MSNIFSEIADEAEALFKKFKKAAKPEEEIVVKAATTIFDAAKTEVESVGATEVQAILSAVGSVALAAITGGGGIEVAVAAVKAAVAPALVAAGKALTDGTLHAVVSAFVATTQAAPAAAA